MISSQRKTIYRPVVDQSSVVAFTGTSAQSGTLKNGVYYLCPSETCYVTIGSNPTATTSAGMRIPRDAQIAIEITQQSQKIAVIRETTSGNLNICLMS